MNERSNRMKKYNLTVIMSNAWKLFRKYNISFSEALHRAWICAKAVPVNAERIQTAKQELRSKLRPGTVGKNSDMKLSTVASPSSELSSSTEQRGTVQLTKHDSLDVHRCRR